MSDLKLPRHLAIIMDGNGRWATARRHNRVYGHLKGAKVAKTVIEECARLKLPFLTLFAFSTENWLRPAAEVNFLMHLLVRQLRREKATLMRNNIRFYSIGDLTRLPNAVRTVVNETTEATQNNTGMVLTFALSYGGRQELTEVARELVRKAKAGEISENEVDEAALARMLPSSFLPDPDLIVRTSGESRISNFFLWQSAYSEIFFEEKSWPDFSLMDLNNIFVNFSARERRFGRTSEQVLRN